MSFSLSQFHEAVRILEVIVGSYYKEMLPMGTKIITHENNWPHSIHESLTFADIPNSCDSNTVYDLQYADINK